MWKRRVYRIIIKIAIYIASIAALLPLVLAVIYSVTDRVEMTRYFSWLADPARPEFLPVKIIPDTMSLRQYYDVLIEKLYYLRFLFNSAKYAIGIVAGQLIVAPLAAYAFSRFRFKFRDGLFFIYIVIMMLPFQAYMLANYFALDSVGLIDSGWSLVIPGIFAPFSVFLLRQYMVNVPDEIMEAASIDGAGPMMKLTRIMLPMVSPGLAAMVVLSFAESWNMVEQPLLFINDRIKYPLSLILQEVSPVSQPDVFAAITLFLSFPVLLFLIFNEDVVQGIENIKLPE